MTSLILKITLVVLVVAVMGGAGVFYLNSRTETKKAETVEKINQSGALSKFLADKTARVQSIADENYVKRDTEIDTSYPWISKLPIYDKTYFVYFNINQKQFFGKIYNTNAPDTAKEAALRAMRTARIPVGQYPIVWDIKVATPSPTVVQ